MATTTEAPVAETGPLDARARAAFFRTKMDAEWGPHDLKKMLDQNRDGVIVIDTRPPEAFAEEHIPGAVNIPTERLSAHLNDLPKDKDIVPYCWSVVCHLATRASMYLAEQGYRVHELAGGIEYWKKYEMPIERGGK